MGEGMQAKTFVVLLWMVSCAQAWAQDCPDIAPYQPAREVIEDLNRIVAPDGVQESYAARIGGIEQWVTVRGQDRANPIILFVHGGPASPLTPTLWQFQRPLEEYFTMITYDQRAAGKTFAANASEGLAGTIRIERYVDDAIELAEHLRKRYGKDKLILMGHSWGTVIGMHAALRRPDLFHAYVGVGQMIDARAQEALSYGHGVEQAKAHGNEAALEELATIAPYPGDQPITRERIIIARKWAQFYGGLTAYRETSRYFFRAPRLSPEYSAADVCAIDQGNLFTLEKILPELMAVDFTDVRSFPIPVVMFMGRHDYSTPSQPIEAWLQRVQAPFKQGVWFERSSHMMPWEEPGKFLVSLLQHVRPLANPPEGSGFAVGSRTASQR
jgi:pimeloyl-ACP methyl ester carboxylesterase